MKKISKLIGLFMMSFVFALIIGVTDVHADWNVSNGNSGGTSENVSGCGTGGRYPILWITQNAKEGDVISGFGYNYTPISKTLQRIGNEKIINQVSFLSINYMNARGLKFVHTNLNGCSGGYYSNGIKGTWVNWQYLSSMRKDAALYGQTILHSNVSAAVKRSYSLPDNMVNEIKKLGGKVVANGFENFLYYDGNDSTCSSNKYSTNCDWYDLITDGEVLWKPKEKITTKKVIVKGTCTGEDCDSFDEGNGRRSWCTDDSCSSFDISRWDNGKLWNEAPQTVKYVYESKEGEYEYHHTLTYTLVTIRYHETWEENSDTGEIRNKKSWYDRGSEVTESKKANWQAKKPALETKFYKPYDLYTEEQVPQSEANRIFSGDRLKYLSNDPLKLKVDNKIDQDMSLPEDQRYLTTIDDNGNLSWNLTFYNDQFGIPTKAEGGLDIYKDHKSVNEIGIGVTQYYNPVFHLNSSTTNNNVTSLYFANDKDKEAIGNSEILQYYGNRGGDYHFKSIQTGTYKISSKKWDGYWSVEYQSSEYFKYGSRYEGTVTIVGDKLVWTPLENGNIKVVETNKYTGEEKGSFVQPILRGGIKVKTVGGYNP